MAHAMVTAQHRGNLLNIACEHFSSNQNARTQSRSGHGTARPYRNFFTVIRNLLYHSIILSSLTVPLRSAAWICSRSTTGHQHSAIRHFWVTSRLNIFIVWYMALIFLICKFNNIQLLLTNKNIIIVHVLVWFLLHFEIHNYILSSTTFWIVLANI
jgi:hypothetical protein